jgi:hypothetical protein
MPSAERAVIFAETADRKGVSKIIVEKDFWVCWVLQQLFSIEALSGRLLFKGGTSLSKIFHAINRFSEDIDLAVDYAALGFTGDLDPRQERISKSRRARILDDMMAACRQFIAGDFLTELRRRCVNALGAGDSWGVEVSAQDPNVVLFRYPAGGGGPGYVTPQIVLELGTHAEFVPHGMFTIRPFIAEEFPQLLQTPDIAVKALLAKRTFWEKATILHAEYHRPADKPLPGRYSRHYYDMAMLAQTAIRTEALGDMGLLTSVVRHKRVFYPSAWSRYDLAHPGSIRLVPPPPRMAPLRRDYRDMEMMIFGQPPAFEAIMERLGDLEHEINS